MKIHWMNLLGITLLLCLGLQACGTANPAVISTVPTVAQPQATKAQPAAPMATDTATQAPAATQPPSQATVQHVSMPGSPLYIGSQKAPDCVDARIYKQKQPVGISPLCDNLDAKIVDRPYSSDLATYFPYLDISQGQFGTTKDWYFSRIFPSDPTVSGGASGDLYYFFKVDLNLNQQQTNLVIYSVKNLPASAQDWTTTGVQAWSEVGSTLTLVFDQGVGADPDAVWVRRVGETIEFAVKPALINNTIRFGWSAWAYQGTSTPPDLATVDPASNIWMLDSTCVKGFNATLPWLPNACR